MFFHIFTLNYQIYAKEYVGDNFAVKRWCQADIKRIWIWIEIGRKGSRSFCQILKAVQIPIKILKKDLDPGSSDPPIRSSNSLPNCENRPNGSI